MVASNIAKLTLLLLGVSACSFDQTREYQSEQLGTRLLKIDRVVIAPPMVAVDSLGWLGRRTPLDERERLLEGALIEAARNELLAAGYQVVDFDALSALQEDPRLRRDLQQLEQDFKERYPSTRGQGQPPPPNSPAKRSYYASLGYLAKTLASSAGADAVLLWHYTG